VHESRSGRQLLQSAGGNNAPSLICNITGSMFLYAENITVIKDGNNEPLEGLHCTTIKCGDNATVYVSLTL